MYCTDVAGPDGQVHREQFRVEDKDSSSLRNKIASTPPVKQVIQGPSHSNMDVALPVGCLRQLDLLVLVGRCPPLPIDSKTSFRHLKDP